MLLLVAVTVVLFILAYHIYGRYLERWYDINDGRLTPAHTDYDGIDRMPTNKAILFGHHFSSIAGAGPIVGPIIACLAFGWLPTLLWIIIGAIFIGGVHDFSALIASVRHRARSIAEIAREYMSPIAYKLFLAFIWLSLIYVLIVFADLTAGSFVENGGVATSSIMYVALAVGFGIAVYRFKLSILRGSLVFVPLVFAAVWAGQLIPISAEKVSTFTSMDPKKVWSMILIGYCFIASTLPVWILLQPRDYLSSFLLYASVLGGFIGILLGGFHISYPAFTGFSDAQLGSLFPILFITVACGACSGFHSLVASGTSSKQLNKESDVRAIGYGSLLVEGIVAVIALATVAMLAKGDALSAKPPLLIYSAGMSKFLAVFGLPEKIGGSFGLLAMSTFILTTLDTATRLGRYIFEEFFNLKNSASRYLSTAATLVLPVVFALITLKDANGNIIPVWRAIWPVFGATNQLLAGLVLLVVAVWLKSTGRRISFVLWPMVFMNVMTLWALVLLLKQYKFSVVGIIAGVLLLLAIILIAEAYKTVMRLIKS